MRPKDHVIYGTVAGAALYPALGADSLIFWAASFGIDLDHYIDYVYHNGFTDFSFKGMFAYHKELENHWHSPEFLNVEVFHTVEFMAPLLLYAYGTGSKALSALCLGFIFHIVLDMAFLYRKGIFSVRANSVTEYFIRKRLLIDKGLSPDSIYSGAVRAVREKI